MEHALKTQRNIWVHLIFGLLVLAAAVWIKMSLLEISLLTLTVAFVIVTEMINTAIEEVVNLTKPETHTLAGLAKNIAAGAVLVAALGSIIIGMLLFVPRVMQ